MSEPKNESQDPVVPTSAELAEGDYTRVAKNGPGVVEIDDRPMQNAARPQKLRITDAVIRGAKFFRGKR